MPLQRVSDVRSRVLYLTAVFFSAREVGQVGWPAGAKEEEIQEWDVIANCNKDDEWETAKADAIKEYDNPDGAKAFKNLIKRLRENITKAEEKGVLPELVEYRGGGNSTDDGSGSDDDSDSSDSVSDSSGNR